MRQNAEQVLNNFYQKIQTQQISPLKLYEQVLLCLICSSLSGLFCENPPPMILLQTSPCDQSDCQNSAQCLVVAGEPVCRCLPGFYGNKCDKMATVHFRGRDGYVELPGTKLRPTAHISLQVRATSDLSCFGESSWNPVAVPDFFRNACINHHCIRFSLKNNKHHLVWCLWRIERTQPLSAVLYGKHFGAWSRIVSWSNQADRVARLSADEAK